MREFDMGESVCIKASNIKTIIHHVAQFPGEDWKYYIEDEKGRFVPFSADELERI